MASTRLMAIGAYQGMRRNPLYSDGAALIADGILLKAISQAEVHQWEMLPRTTYILPLRVSPGTHTVTVDFPGLPGMERLPD
jgi:hypothetical protein